MKTKSKILATILAIAMLATLVPVMALAAAGDVATVKIKGIEASIGTADVDAGSATPGSIALPYELRTIDATDIVVTVADSGSDPTAIRRFDDNAAFLAAALSPDAAGDDFSTGTDLVLADGNVLLIKSANDEYTVINVTVGDNPIGTIPGDSDVLNAVIKVVLPTDLDFTINPLQVGDFITGSQISGTDFSIVNKSNVPVKVGFTITATYDATVTQVAQGATAGSSSEKNVFFAALAANAIGTANPTFTAPISTGYAYSADANLVPFVGSGTTGTAELNFALGAATGDTLDTLAAADAGVASFQFFGEVNDLAIWEAGDITVSGAYTLQGLKGSTYDAITTVPLNVIDETPLGKFEIKAGAPGTITFDKATREEVATNKDAEGYSIKVYFSAPNKPTEITYVKNFLSNGVWTEGAQYEYDETTGVFTISSALPGVSTVDGVLPTIVIDTDAGTWLLRFDID